MKRRLLKSFPHKLSILMHNDSDSEDDEPRKFRVEIKPVHSDCSSHYTVPSLDELKESIGNITLSPAISVSKLYMLFSR
ncbi:hypothetical protein Chor_007871 [Crotalus horridus]